MNILEGVIEDITVHEGLSLVRVKVGEIMLTAIVIDTPDTVPYLQLGNPVKALFKETEVIIGEDIDHPISLQNKIHGTINHIVMGDLLCKLVMDTSVGTISSIITANAVRQLKLKEGISVIAMIKTNEMMLSE